MIEKIICRKVHSNYLVHLWLIKSKALLGRFLFKINFKLHFENNFSVFLGKPLTNQLTSSESAADYQMARSVYFCHFIESSEKLRIRTEPAAALGLLWGRIFWSGASTFDTSWPRVATEKFCEFCASLWFSHQKKREWGSDPAFGNSWPGTTKNFALVKATKSVVRFCEGLQSFSGARTQTRRVWFLNCVWFCALCCNTNISAASLPKTWTLDYVNVVRCVQNIFFKGMTQKSLLICLKKYISVMKQNNW